MTMRAPGHSIMLIRQGQRDGTCLITLECTCEKVIHGGLFAVDDILNQALVRSEGYEKARAHLVETLCRKES